ncbi:hypothetical protein MKX03_027224 [Papaver bracteatum]|nr:hypothetical protein MKX03_027224 [Papaver bracteatum]
MVIAIACPIDNSNMIVPLSPDKSILVWILNKQEYSYGDHKLRLTGHSHFVQDVVLSSDAKFALSASCDGELRLWDLNSGVTTRRFLDHTIKLWNTLGECKYTIQDGDSHTNWVSCVRFIPQTSSPTIVSASWDKTVKVWNLTNCSSLDAGGIIHGLCFSPNRYWLCVATEEGVQIWDYQSKSLIQDLKIEPESGENKRVYCSGMNWSSDGSTLFTGYTDGVIRVWGF